MGLTLKLTKIGNSTGVVLPKSELERMGVKEGDTLYAVTTPDGIRLTAYDPDFAEALEAGRDYMNRHRDALKELAK